MALTKATLASALGAGDTVAVLSASTGVAAGYILRIDDEQMLVAGGYTVAGNGVNVPVIRGQNGTRAAAHVSGANAIVGIASDWTNPDPTLAVQFPLAGRARLLTSYSAAGAITLPTPGNDAVAVINGTNALAMTLATPTKDMDGCLLFIVGNGKAAHTVAPATALNDAGSNFDTAITFASGGRQVVVLIAVNEFWSIVPSVAAGTLTNVTVTYS